MVVSEQGQVRVVNDCTRRHEYCPNISGGGEVRPLTDVLSDPHLKQSSAGARREGCESCFETQIRVSHVEAKTVVGVERISRARLGAS
jgi:hypothetical protein